MFATKLQFSFLMIWSLFFTLTCAMMSGFADPIMSHSTQFNVIFLLQIKKEFGEEGHNITQTL